MSWQIIFFTQDECRKILGMRLLGLWRFFTVERQRCFFFLFGRCWKTGSKRLCCKQAQGEKCEKEIWWKPLTNGESGSSEVGERGSSETQLPWEAYLFLDGNFSPTKRRNVYMWGSEKRERLRHWFLSWEPFPFLSVQFIFPLVDGLVPFFSLFPKISPVPQPASTPFTLHHQFRFHITSIHIIHRHSRSCTFRSAKHFLFHGNRHYPTSSGTAMFR